MRSSGMCARCRSTCGRPCWMIWALCRPCSGISTAIPARPAFASTSGTTSSQAVPLEIETAAYQIVQEALTNTARHAHVQEVFVGLVIQEDTLWVEILDNGRGFDANAEPDVPAQA